MAVTVEEMFAEQNQGFGLDAVTGTDGNGASVPWAEAVSAVWTGFMQPYLNIKYGLQDEATKSATGKDGQKAVQAAAAGGAKATDWGKIALFAGVAVVGYLALKKVL